MCSISSNESDIYLWHKLFCLSSPWYDLHIWLDVKYQWPVPTLSFVVTVPCDVPVIQGYQNGSTVEVPYTRRSLQLVCEARNGRPAAELEWFRNEQKVVQNVVYETEPVASDDKRTNAKSTLSLSLQGNSENDAVYRCQAKNSAVIGQPLSTVVTISILCKWGSSECYLPLSPSVFTVYVTEWDSVLLQCLWSVKHCPPCSPSVCYVRKFSLLLCLWLVSFYPLCAPSVCYLRKFSLLLCLWLVSFCLCSSSVCCVRKFSLLLWLWSVSFCLCSPYVCYVRKFICSVWLVNPCPLGLLSVYVRIFTLVPSFFLFSLFLGGGGGEGGGHFVTVSVIGQLLSILIYFLGQSIKKIIFFKLIVEALYLGLELLNKVWSERKEKKRPTPFIKRLLAVSVPFRARTDSCSLNAKQRVK